MTTGKEDSERVPSDRSEASGDDDRIGADETEKTTFDSIANLAQREIQPRYKTEVDVTFTEVPGSETVPEDPPELPKLKLDQGLPDIPSISSLAKGIAVFGRHSEGAIARASHSSDTERSVDEQTVSGQTGIGGLPSVIQDVGVASPDIPIGTPDGRSFRRGALGIPMSLAWRVTKKVSRFVYRCLSVFWRWLSEIDDAFMAGLVAGAKAVAHFIGAISIFFIKSVRDLLMWLPTPLGRAYCSAVGAIAIVTSLWIFDELRGATGQVVDRELILLPPEAANDPIVAKVAGRFVRLSEIRSAFEASGFVDEESALSVEAAFERGFVDAFIEQRLLARAAREEGLQREADVAQRLSAAREQILASAFVERRADEAAGPDRVRRLYDKQADLVRLGDEIRVRHILVPTYDQAKNIIQQLEAGADFADLARAQSTDRATGPKGGEIGYFTRGMMAPSLANAAFSTPVGQVANPFFSEFGWHILEVLDRRPSSTVRFSDVKDDIAEYLSGRAIDRTLEDLKQEADVVYFQRPTGNTNEPRPEYRLSIDPITQGPNAAIRRLQPSDNARATIPQATIPQATVPTEGGQPKNAPSV
ncbi:MAG: peptidylprolyl isomerase, partial [Pseudomonadota bacterium]